MAVKSMGKPSSKGMGEDASTLSLSSVGKRRESWESVYSQQTVNESILGSRCSSAFPQTSRQNQRMWRKTSSAHKNGNTEKTRSRWNFNSLTSFITEGYTWKWPEFVYSAVTWNRSEIRLLTIKHIASIKVGRRIHFLLGKYFRWLIPKLSKIFWPLSLLPHNDRGHFHGKASGFHLQQIQTLSPLIGF